MPRIPNTRPTSIYWLYDMRPESLVEWPEGLPFYCGKTVTSVNLRFKCHKATALRHPKRPVSAWFQTCKDYVRVGVIEVVTADGDWRARERSWICELRTINPNCANVSDGGDGVPGTVQSAETRAKISAANKGRKLSAEHRASLKGRKFSVEHRAKMRAQRLGKTASPESRAKMSASRKGRTFSPEHLAKIKIANTGRKLSPEHVAKMRGRKHTAETRAKLSALRMGKGHPLSAEHRAKIGEANRRRIVSDETRAKISARRKGVPTTTGRRHSPETIAKLRAAKVGKKQTPEQIAKRVAKNTGQKRSQEVCARMREAQIASRARMAAA